MAATLITETEWHESPGYGPTQYAIGYLGQMVASPYYNDGRLVPEMGYFTSNTPGADLVAQANIGTAGPAASVDFTLAGIFGDLTGIDIVIDRTGSTIWDPGTLFADGVQNPIQAAASLAALISLEPDMSAVAVANQVTVTAVAPATALTITTLAVA